MELETQMRLEPHHSSRYCYWWWRAFVIASACNLIIKIVSKSQKNEEKKELTWNSRRVCVSSPTIPLGIAIDGGVRSSSPPHVI